MTVLAEPRAWETPIDLRRDTTRRLFAQELVSRMASVGSATREELLALPVLVFKVAPTEDELSQIMDVARRLGWLEVDAASGVWQLTDAGRTVRRPPSLAILQVATRIASVANPVRTQAKDWVPLIALVAGTVTAGVSAQWDSTVAIRWLAVAVLLFAIVWQFLGEWQIVLGVRAWPRAQKDERCLALRRLYSTFRLIWAAMFDGLLIAAFTLAIFGRFLPALIVLGAGGFFGVVHLIAWSLPAAAMKRDFQGR